MLGRVSPYQLSLWITNLKKFVIMFQASTSTQELWQSMLGKLKCFKPVNTKQISRNACRQALTPPMFFAEKCSGEVKACACTNGSTQRTHVAKEEATAPTVTLEVIFIQCTIFAHKQ
jgi:hypothetical protein